MLTLTLLGVAFAAPALAGDKDKPRRIFVLHAGIHTVIANPSINISAERLEQGLIKRGVPERDIVLMTNPFPKATWKSLFPKEAIELVIDSLDPNSAIVQDAYLRMHAGLQERKVGPEDEIIWVGHSAGGQLGMTVAHVAHCLDKFPELAKKAKPYRITMVVTLGTPVGAALLPEDVLLRNYCSDGDTVVRLATKSAWLASVTLKFKGKFHAHAPTLNKNWKARLFNDIQHNEWTKEHRVIDRILCELAPEQCPGWQSALCPRPGLGLAQLLCHAVEQEFHFSFEDPPAK